MLPAASVELVSSLNAGEELKIMVTEIDPNLHGQEVVLSVSAEVRARWSARSESLAWSGVITGSDVIEVALLAPVSNLTLWSGTVRVYEAVHLDLSRSLLVTTADGSLQAELACVGSSNSRRKSIEDALLAAGFVTKGWINGVLSVGGSTDTLGLRVVSVTEGPGRIELRIFTLTDVQLRLSHSGPFVPGDSATLRAAAGEIVAGLHELDGGPLGIAVERVEPLFDTLSAAVRGNRIHFRHAGRYSIALVASRRRLAQFPWMYSRSDRHIHRRP